VVAFGADTTALHDVVRDGQDHEAAQSEAVGGSRMNQGDPHG
jgi:hypothetical protein